MKTNLIVTKPEQFVRGLVEDVFQRQLCLANATVVYYLEDVLVAHIYAADAPFLSWPTAYLMNKAIALYELPLTPTEVQWRLELVQLGNAILVVLGFCPDMINGRRRARAAMLLEQLGIRVFRDASKVDGLPAPEAGCLEAVSGQVLIEVASDFRLCAKGYQMVRREIGA
ncbi:MAG: hypothetical protein U1C49_00180 [Candidatus Andersenbacteria bacterium]|nr:hypothetical protein [bacterium]MDZ4225242.1 hypothetical protein [Candidatus Andersenbacteria bacterium]